MAFKMTPGIKGNPAKSRIASLGACGGPGQPPCEPRFEKEVKEEKRMKAMDRTSSSRSKSIKPKIKSAPVEAPTKPTKPTPVKLTINLPKGFGFKSQKEKMMFYESVNEAISQGEFENQEQLDKYVMKQLVNAPKPPIDGGPVIIDPDKPILNPDIPVLGPIKGGQKYESELNDKMKAASIEQAKARFAPVESSAASKVKPKG